MPEVTLQIRKESVNAEVRGDDLREQNRRGERGVGFQNLCVPVQQSELRP